jgi:hypothetical protein
LIRFRSVDVPPLAELGTFRFGVYARSSFVAGRGDRPVGRDVDEDEVIEHWTLIGEELTQLAGKRGPTKLAFALSLKFHQLHGRFPRGRAELPDDVVEFVAKAVGVPAVELGA